MSRVLGIIGVLACVVGAIWIGQGLGLLPGSFMSGQRQWAARGAVLLVVGLLLAWRAWRRPRR